MEDGSLLRVVGSMNAAAELAHTSARGQYHWAGGPGAEEVVGEHAVREAWEAWKAYYGKAYGGEEDLARVRVFQANVERIQHLNSRQPQAHFRLNKFADLSHDEFKQRYMLGSYNAAAKATNVLPSLHAPLPSSFDWRDHNAVTPVKNQGQCGSCWAFSVTETIESAWFLAGHSLPVLAPQQIVDCDQGRGDQGCNGGDTPTAYQYVIAQGGLDTEASYPYTGEDDTCSFKQADVAAKITSWAYVTKNNNETQMQVSLVAKGPLSICVEADTWQFYEGGVITSDCGQNLDHCVQITGYGPEQGWDFETYQVWLIRNSWGEDWGYSGYLYVQRGKNLCGVSDEVTLPIV